MIIYVVGVGRSGTSLLQSILGSHTLISAISETSFIRRYVFGSCGESDILEDKYLRRIPEFHLELQKLVSPISKDDFLSCYECYITRHFNNHVLDKDPRLVEYASLMLNSSLKSKFVNIYRDPRDVLSSKKKANWSAGRSLLSYLVASKVQISDALLLDTHPNIMSVKYENLITDTKTTVQSLCEFLGINFEHGMLSFQNTAKSLVHSDEVQWKKETFEPINPNNANQWKSNLTPIEAISSYLTVRHFCDQKGYTMDLANFSRFDIGISYLYAITARVISFCYKAFRLIKVKANER